MRAGAPRGNAPSYGGHKVKRLVLAVVLMAGCGSTGVILTGRNEYMISKTDIGDTWSEGAKVLAKLYVEANEFCAEKEGVSDLLIPRQRSRPNS